MDQTLQIFKLIVSDTYESGVELGLSPYMADRLVGAAYGFALDNVSVNDRNAGTADDFAAEVSDQAEAFKTHLLAALDDFALETRDKDVQRKDVKILMDWLNWTCNLAAIESLAMVTWNKTFCESTDVLRLASRGRRSPQNKR